MESMVATAVNKIRFDFHPRDPKGVFTVEKEDGGRKRRYMEGVTSGIALDGHGERMTEKAIASFREQANSGNVLLFPDRHEIKYTEDIGKLVTFDVDDAMDWVTSYRLYDDLDGVGPVKLEKNDTIWRQANGLPPYDKPRAFGFSIEGDIPDNGILEMDQQGRRVIDAVNLQGVVLVRDPAYRTSVAHAVMKALNIPTPQEIRKSLMGGTLADMADAKALERDFFDQKYQLQDALEEMIRSIMISAEPDKADRLRGVFGEYTELMIECISRNPEVFRDSGESNGEAAPSQVYEAETVAPKQELLDRLVEAHGQLQKIAARLKEEGEDGNEQEQAR